VEPRPPRRRPATHHPTRRRLEISQQKDPVYPSGSFLLRLRSAEITTTDTQHRGVTEKISEWPPCILCVLCGSAVRPSRRRTYSPYQPRLDNPQVVERHVDLAAIRDCRAKP